MSTWSAARWLWLTPPWEGWHVLTYIICNNMHMGLRELQRTVIINVPVLVLVANYTAGSMQLSMRKLNSHTILQNYTLCCCCHVMYKLPYPSIRVRTAPPVSVGLRRTWRDTENYPSCLSHLQIERQDRQTYMTMKIINPTTEKDGTHWPRVICELRTGNLWMLLRTGLWLAGYF